MRGLLRFFGWLACVSGMLGAGSVVVSSVVNTRVLWPGIEVWLLGFSWILGGLFTLAVCLTIARIDERLEVLTEA